MGSQATKPFYGCAIGIPRAISVSGMTYQPTGVAGSDMAMYRGPQDWIVKKPDGHCQVFPVYPTFRKMRLMNLPVLKNRFKWTLLSEEQLGQPKEDVKEAESKPVNPSIQTIGEKTNAV